MSTRKPKIVVLDGYALNPGDLSWDPLEALGNLEVFDRSTPEEVIQRASSAECVLTNKASLLLREVERLPRLEYIGVTATGYNVVAIEYAREHGITVTNVPAYSTDSVAQMVFAHLLNLTQRVGAHADSVRQGKWAAAKDWCYWDSPQIELRGLVMGIVGFGQIGRATAKLADAFGMHVLAVNRSPVAAPDYVQITDIDALFRQSDVVSLHCPLTPETKGLVGRERLASMKPTAFLINTSRGPLVDETALADALNAGKIAGAGLDVLSKEPPSADNPLAAAQNCFITPHIAWATRASRERLLDVVVENLAAFLRGQPENVISG